MTISVVLTTYNGRKYLKEQMDSLAGQSRPADEGMTIQQMKPFR